MMIIRVKFGHLENTNNLAKTIFYLLYLLSFVDLIQNMYNSCLVTQAFKNTLR